MGSWVASPRPIELFANALTEAPGNHGVMEFCLAARRRPQNAAAARRPGPFVKIAGIPIDAERRYIEFDCARGVCPVNQNSHVPLFAPRCNFRDWEDEAAVRNNMIDQREAGAR